MATDNYGLKVKLVKHPLGNYIKVEDGKWKEQLALIKKRKDSNGRL